MTLDHHTSGLAAPGDLRRFREAVHRAVARATQRGDFPAVAGRRLGLMLGRMPYRGRPPQPRAEPALAWLPAALRAARRGPHPGLTHRAAPLLSHLRWQEEYAEDAITEDLRQKYAHADVVGREGLLTGEGVRLGLVLLGPRAFYPAHAHAAEEAYILLGGGSWWRRGDARWGWEPPGRAIYHPAHMPHAMRTGPHPVLAVYAWWGQVDRPAVFLRRWLRDRSSRSRGVTRSPAGRPGRAG